MPGAGQSPVSPAVPPGSGSRGAPSGRDHSGTQRAANAFMPWVQVLQMGVFVWISNER